MTYCRLSFINFHLHIKIRSNWMNFLWTDGRTDTETSFYLVNWGFWGPHTLMWGSTTRILHLVVIGHPTKFSSYSYYNRSMRIADIKNWRHWGSFQLCSECLTSYKPFYDRTCYCDVFGFTPRCQPLSNCRSKYLPIEGLLLLREAEGLEFIIML